MKQSIEMSETERKLTAEVARTQFALEDLEERLRLAKGVLQKAKEVTNSLRRQYKKAKNDANGAVTRYRRYRKAQKDLHE